MTAHIPGIEIAVFYITAGKYGWIGIPAL